MRRPWANPPRRQRPRRRSASPRWLCRSGSSPPSSSSTSRASAAPPSRCCARPIAATTARGACWPWSSFSPRGQLLLDLRDYPFVHGTTRRSFRSEPARVPAPRPHPARAAILSVSGHGGPRRGPGRRCVRRETGDGRLAGSFALLLLAPWFVQTWAALGRVDMLACLLSLAGLHLFHRVGPDGRGRFAAYACFSLAFFTKQNALLAPAALVLGLRPRPARPVPKPRASWSRSPCPCSSCSGSFARRPAARPTSTSFPTRPPLTTSGTGCGAPIGTSSPSSAPSRPDPACALALDGRRHGSHRELPRLLALEPRRSRHHRKAGAAQNYFIEPYVATLALAALLVGSGPSGERPGGPGLARVPPGGGGRRDRRGHGAWAGPPAPPRAAGARGALRRGAGHERSHPLRGPERARLEPQAGPGRTLRRPSHLARRAS